MNRRQFLWATAVAAGALRAQALDGSTWEFRPESDRFDPDSLLDLRYLNETEAGQSGFVRVDDGGHFLLGDGKPARFWAVNTTVGREKPYTVRPLWRRTEPSLERHARFLAKRGVNMVRCHAFLNPPVTAASIDEIQKGDRDWIWRTVAAMKKEGIYTTISPYFPLQMRFRAEWDIPGGATQDPHGMLFTEPRLQQAYKSWLRQLYDEVNPYTGIRLADDPAVALIQLQNEDSLFFWTIDRQSAVQKENLRRMFGAWAVKKYGNIEAARQKWGVSMPNDKPDEGQLDYYILWELTQPQRGGKALRVADQTQFFAETMHTLYREFERFLREDLGCKQLINAGNWKTGDAVRMNDIERWTYTANQVTAVNRYFTGVHQGDSRYRSWAVRETDTFTDPSVLKNPSDFALNLKQTEGSPMIVTEGLWVQPHRYVTEGPFLISAYMSLTGIQGYYWFSTAEDEWAPPQSANGYLASLAKFEFSRPDVLGLFPAAALLYRMGYVREGRPSVREVRNLQSMWDRRTPMIAENPTYDPNRDAGDMAPEASIRTGVPLKAFLVGPVRVKFGGSEQESTVMNLDDWVAPDKVWSNTEELVFDTGIGACTMNTPRAQGVAAFFENQREFRLDTITVRCDHAYGSVTVVSMDGKPLSEAGRVLVQIGTQAFPTGWRTEPAENGTVIAAMGRAPWQVVRARGELEIRNPRLTQGWALDPNGIARAELRLEHADGGVRFTLPPESLYAVLI